MGPIGPQGPAGANGLDGATGPQGPPGLDGTFTCGAGELLPCYSGSFTDILVNGHFISHPAVQCRTGFKTCEPSGSFSAACQGEILPSTEVCGDGIDNNCDGVVDEGCPATPGNAGYEICASSSDCQGGDVCTDGTCVPGPPAPPVVCDDADGDGFADGACGGGDCDDSNPNVHPGAVEICDGLDNNCDGQIDENCTVCTDADGDGYAVEGGVCGPVDCNDADPSVSPGVAIDGCDGIDNNCNGVIDEHADPQWMFVDVDRDGYADQTIAPIFTCEALPNRTWGILGYDCDDADFLVNPGRPEVCADGIDNNCNGQVDETGCVVPPSGF